MYQISCSSRFYDILVVVGSKIFVCKIATVFKISAGLEYAFASYSDFSKCVERLRRKKLESLLTHILETL